jgi:hypothetical protein
MSGRERERGWDKRERETLGQEEEEANNKNLFRKKEPVSCVCVLCSAKMTGSSKSVTLGQVHKR